MARTRQTARRATGGMAPRKQLATRAAIRRSYENEENPYGGTPQVQMFTATATTQTVVGATATAGTGSAADTACSGVRTIVVEGTAELVEYPDMVHLSFLINETGDSIQDGIQKAMSKMAHVRQIATSIDDGDDGGEGIPNANITSDSIGSKGKRTEYGYYVTKNNNKKRKKSDDYDYGDDEEDDDSKEWIPTSIKTVYEIKSVIRICLEGADLVERVFSKLCYRIMSEVGLRTYSAPIYDLTELTHHRNLARVSACENAKEKATKILEALDDPTIKLGVPICIRDIHCDIEDDAANSFAGNYSTWGTTYETVREMIPNPNDDDKEEESTRNESTTKPTKFKKARFLSSTDGGDDENNDDVDAKSTITTTTPPKSLDETIASQIFAVPPIRISACVQTVFEIERN